MDKFQTYETYTSQDNPKSRRVTIFIVLTVLAVGGTGYLYYTGYFNKLSGDISGKTTRIQAPKVQQKESKEKIYSWTDKNGVKHYSDTVTSKDATNIKESEGVEISKFSDMMNTVKAKLQRAWKKIKSWFPKSGK